MLLSVGVVVGVVAVDEERPVEVRQRDDGDDGRTTDPFSLGTLVRETDWKGFPAANASRQRDGRRYLYWLQAEWV